MDWIAGNSLYKPSPYTRQQQQSTMHAVNIYNTQYRISYSKFCVQFLSFWDKINI